MIARGKNRYAREILPRARPVAAGADYKRALILVFVAMAPPTPILHHTYRKSYTRWSPSNFNDADYRSAPLVDRLALPTVERGGDLLDRLALRLRHKSPGEEDEERQETSEHEERVLSECILKHIGQPAV